MKNSYLIRGIILFMALCAVGAFFYFDLSRFLSLEYIKESQLHFQQLYAEHQLTVIGIYMGMYIVVTALSLPGAVFMTLAGGGLFGLTVGTVIISFSSTIGATIACLVARTLLRDWVQRKFGDKLTAVNDGINREGGFYLFTLRLIPVFPFFIINLVMGLTSMRLWTFFWVSQLGMLPGTLVYVNAGKQLGQIESASGILSPGLWISFIILGLFPITMKKLLPVIRSRFAPDTVKD